MVLTSFCARFSMCTHVQTFGFGMFILTPWQYQIISSGAVTCLIWTLWLIWHDLSCWHHRNVSPRNVWGSRQSAACVICRATLCCRSRRQSAAWVFLGPHYAADRFASVLGVLGILDSAFSSSVIHCNVAVMRTFARFCFFSELVRRSKYLFGGVLMWGLVLNFQRWHVTGACCQHAK